MPFDSIDYPRRGAVQASERPGATHSSRPDFDRAAPVAPSSDAVRAVGVLEVPQQGQKIFVRGCFSYHP